jgi:hypothetical protein
MNAETQATAHTGKGTIARAVLLFLLGFVLSAAILHVLIGSPFNLYAVERSEKLEILRRSNYAYSTAIFGSSHVQQGFDPRAFDAVLAGTPLAVRSFNLGIDGGAQIEQRLMALDFLDHLKPPATNQPCFVMLEATADPTFATYFSSNPRQINILDWRSMRLILEFPPDGYKRPNQIHRRLISFSVAFNHLINMGMLSNRIFRPPYNEAVMLAETENDQRGMHHVPTNIYEQEDLARAFSRRASVPVAVPAQLFQGNADIVQDLHNAPNGDRVQLIWVVMPLLGDLVRYKVYPASEPTSFGEVPILDLGRPDLYPQLYDRSLWLDSQHMNAQGSQLFSRLLAQQLLAWAHDHPVHGCGG